MRTEAKEFYVNSSILPILPVDNSQKQNDGTTFLLTGRHSSDVVKELYCTSFVTYLVIAKEDEGIS